MDDIAAEFNFEWRLQDGVVNISPVGSMPPLLQINLHSFQWDTHASVKGLIVQLRGSAEVSQGAQELGLKRGRYGNSQSAICVSDCTEKEPPNLESAKDVTLLAVLNRIFRAHPGAIWIYSEHRCGNDASFTLDTLAE